MITIKNGFNNEVKLYDIRENVEGIIEMISNDKFDIQSLENFGLDNDIVTRIIYCKQRKINNETISRWIFDKDFPLEIIKELIYNGARFNEIMVNTGLNDLMCNMFDEGVDFKSIKISE